MSAPIQSPTLFPSSGLRILSAREQLQRTKAMTCNISHGSKPACIGNLQIGLFFDGTGNNMQDHYSSHGHSNIVRLFNAYPNKPRDGYARYYIPGVGTPFPEIGENSYSTLGKAMASGGEQRINWGLLQIYNAVHRYLVNNQKLISDERAMTITENMSSDQLGMGNSYRRMVMHTWEKKLEAVVKSQKPELKQINISVFGFSRGAAEARVFCNWFFELCEKKDDAYTLAGVPVRIYFLGIFDTVASVGLANMFTITEGHMAWAGNNMHINPAVEQCVHFVAAHEIRACFPLDSGRRGNQYPPNCKEVVYPGSHSNVGGGYMPFAQGKSGNTPHQKKYNFAALIPAIDMYHEARKAGVPLLPLELMPAQIRQDFDPDPGLVKAYNLYLKKCGVGSQPVEGAINAHMSLYYRYRKMRMQNFTQIMPHDKASPEDRKFLEICNEDFKDGVAELEGIDRMNREVATDPAAYNRKLSKELSRLAMPPALIPERDRNNKLYAPRKLTSEEQGILAALKNKTALEEEIVHFFDHYVHDSLAGFAQDAIREKRINGKGHLRNRKVFVKNG